jgi:hypothetical protein
MLAHRRHIDDFSSVRPAARRSFMERSACRHRYVGRPTVATLGPLYICNPHQHSKQWSWPVSHRLPSRCHRDALLFELQPRERVVYPSGGATGNCTPITAVRKQSSPVELSPQTSGRLGRGRAPASSWRFSSNLRVFLLCLVVSSAGREGIEPSLRVLEARPVTMTLRPKHANGASYRNRTDLTP